MKKKKSKNKMDPTDQLLRLEDFSESIPVSEW